MLFAFVRQCDESVRRIACVAIAFAFDDSFLVNSVAMLQLTLPVVAFCVQASGDHAVYLTTAQGFNLMYVQWPGKSKGSKAQSLRHYRQGFATGTDKAKPMPVILQMLTDDAKK